jgi:hypothetical protein
MLHNLPSFSDGAGCRRLQRCSYHADSFSRPGATHPVPCRIFEPRWFKPFVPPKYALHGLGKSWGWRSKVLACYLPQETKYSTQNRHVIPNDCYLVSGWNLVSNLPTFGQCSANMPAGENSRIHFPLPTKQALQPLNRLTKI